MLKIPACEIITHRRTVSDVQVRKWVRVVFFVFKVEHLNIMVEVADAIIYVLKSFADFLDVTSDVPIVDNETVEKDALWP